MNRVPAVLSHPMLDWIKHGGLAEFVRGSPWAFPTLQSLHFIGMALVVGVVGLIDLRVLGFAPGLPIKPLLGLLPLALLGFAINLITGAMFFAHDPYAYAFNQSFRLKMLLILIAGFNAMWFRWGAAAAAPRRAKLAAAVSIALWLGVICAGRFIAFTGAN
jgi:hypothetical protein